jgi:hypothetical protein
MRSVIMFDKIVPQSSPQRLLIPPDDVVQTLTSDGAHQSLHIGVLPGGSRRRKDFLHFHVLGHGRELVPIDRISIAQ